VQTAVLFALLHLLHVQSAFAREALVCCSFPLATIAVLLAAKYKAMEAEICVGPAPLNSVACGDRADHHRYQPIREPLLIPKLNDLELTSDRNRVDSVAGFGYIPRERRSRL